VDVASEQPRRIGERLSSAAGCWNSMEAPP
jgi:hypothetical protein